MNSKREKSQDIPTFYIVFLHYKEGERCSYLDLGLIEFVVSVESCKRLISPLPLLNAGPHTAVSFVPGWSW
jgi:hypothetical protein